MNWIERRICSKVELLGTVWILLKDLAGIETRGIEEKQREGGGCRRECKNANPNWERRSDIGDAGGILVLFSDTEEKMSLVRWKLDTEYGHLLWGEVG